ncbi:MAG TPA: hypothetical protein VIH00_05055 [Candidatus Limnocylindrales bacterium]
MEATPPPTPEPAPEHQPEPPSPPTKDPTKEPTPEPAEVAPRRGRRRGALAALAAIVVLAAALVVITRQPARSAPTPSPSVAAVPTGASPAPTPDATPRETASTRPSVEVTPEPSRHPAALGPIGPDVTGLPTTGRAWRNVVEAADADPGEPDLTCDQNQREHPGAALASALIYARTGDVAYRDRAIDLIEAAYPTARKCENSILSLGRQLGAYVMAADYVDYRDPEFVAWLDGIRSQNLGGHARWFTLVGTAVDTSNNWGIFALASLTAADAYLEDATALERDFRIFHAYGAGGWSFRRTNDYQKRWACPEGFAINPASCDDPRREGAAVEDASRTRFPRLGQYPAEAAQGYVVQAELLDRQGFAAWDVNDRQVCRNALWRERGDNLNFSNADAYVTWMTNARCGLDQPTDPARMGRVFGFTDWLYGGQ